MNSWCQFRLLPIESLVVVVEILEMKRLVVPTLFVCIPGLALKALTMTINKVGSRRSEHHCVASRVRMSSLDCMDVDFSDFG